MKTRWAVLAFCFFLFPLLLPADEPQGTLEKLLSSLVSGSGVIEAKGSYENALLEQKYRYLQWWLPSLSLSNDFVYPYKHGEFGGLAASNRASLILSAPLPTGTLLDLTASYGLSRSMLTDMLPAEKWGFAQDLQGKIGIGQSLNPWWLHTGKNPYTARAALRADLARNSYNITIKTALFSGIRFYVSLRKAERSRDTLNERIALYNDLLDAYRRMRDNGGISWREFQNIRQDKWEDEETLFSLEQDINTLRGELYKMTGMQVGAVSSERHIASDSPVWQKLFLNVQTGEIRRLEEINVQFQKESLRIERLINRQSNAPLVKFEFGTSFNLPVKETDSLGEAWKKDNFTDNILNNWSLTVSVDLSSFFSPLNRKNEAAYRLSQGTLDKLLENIHTNNENEKNQNAVVIRQLEDHIARLKIIIQDEEKNILDDKELFERGAITELEYRQSMLEYKAKRTLLENFTDDLWLYQFFDYFFIGR
jgi:outer membrane protein TolC